MNLESLTPAERKIRQSIRAFLMLATLEELHIELAISLDRRDPFRANCIHELIDEEEASR